MLFVSAAEPHAVFITDRISKHLRNCIQLCERVHLGHACRVPSTSTYVANKTLPISARVRTHNILRVCTTISRHPWEIMSSFFSFYYFTINCGSETRGFCSKPCYLFCDRQVPALLLLYYWVYSLTQFGSQRVILKWNFKEFSCDVVTFRNRFWVR